MTDRRNISPDIQSALDACRLAWTQHPEATHGWNIHHEVQVEPLTKPIEQRIQYILTFKLERELITRFNNMRPVVSKLSDAYINARKAYIDARDAYVKTRDAYVKTRDAYDKAHDAYDTARNVYDTAHDAFYKAHNAYDKAHDAYDNASDAFYKTRDVYVKARNAYMPGHLIDVPDTTWNGKSIF